MSRTPREVADLVRRVVAGEPIVDPIALARLLDRANDLAVALTAQAT
jgi:hypothetical protein